MTPGKHTFIIPSYKDSTFLEECIKSLQQQTVQSKIVISTSTPSDFISGIATKYNIELIINDQVEGIAADWNFAYQACKTKYITLTHQDDIYKVDYTEQCLNQAEKKKNRNALFVFTDYREIVNGKQKRFSVIILIKKILLSPFLIKNNFSNHFIKKSILSFGNTISCPTVMFNSEAIGTFSFSNEFRYCLDWDAWLRLADMDGKFIYINRKLVYHRIHNDSQTTHQIADNNRMEEEEKIFRRIWNKSIVKLIMMIYRHSSTLNAQKPD